MLFWNNPRWILNGTSSTLQLKEFRLSFDNNHFCKLVKGTFSKLILHLKKGIPFIQPKIEHEKTFVLIYGKGTHDLHHSCIHLFLTSLWLLDWETTDKLAEKNCSSFGLQQVIGTWENKKNQLVSWALLYIYARQTINSQ